LSELCTEEKLRRSQKKKSNCEQWMNKRKKTKRFDDPIDVRFFVCAIRGRAMLDKYRVLGASFAAYSAWQLQTGRLLHALVVAVAAVVCFSKGFWAQRLTGLLLLAYSYAAFNVGAASPLLWIPSVVAGGLGLVFVVRAESGHEFVLM